MKPIYAVTGALLTVCLVGGCVSSGKYNEVVSEKDATMTELERTRSQKTALEQQVKTLKELNVKFSNEAQAREVATQLGAQFDTIDGAGHFWPYQAPAAGAAVLERFWSSLA